MIGDFLGALSLFAIVYSLAWIFYGFGG